MKLKQLLHLSVMIALVAPMLVDAQIYKWKDKNGVTGYSDKPPADDARVDKVISREQASKPTPPADKASKVGGNNKPNKNTETQLDSEDEAAQLRARNAEAEKKKNEEKAAQARIRAENCQSAKSDYQTFAQGGRIYRMNEKGEREYFDDAALNQNKARAQAAIQQYCY